MKIFYCVRSLEAVPSCMYNIQMLQDTGYHVIPVIGRSTESLNRIFSERRLKGYIATNKKAPNKYKDHFVLNKIYKKELMQAMNEAMPDDIVCFGTADSAIQGFNRSRCKRNIIFLKELHETPVYYSWQLKPIVKKASALVCCEKNRSRVLKFRWNLEKTPYTISNKPYGYDMHPNRRPSNKKIEDIVHQIGNQPAIVYQARRIQFGQELENLAEALKRLDKNYLLVAIGEIVGENIKKSVNSVYENTLWTGHVAAPLHLEITSYAKIGVAIYAENSLNNLFCAPNKTFEYAGFGIPSLCNDIPGLEESIGMNQAGVCVNWESVDSIAEGINKIMEHYEFYSRNALNFYQAEDNMTKIKKIIEDVGGEAF